jgi:hypothetical protein
LKNEILKLVQDDKKSRASAIGNGGRGFFFANCGMIV